MEDISYSIIVRNNNYYIKEYRFNLSYFKDLVDSKPEYTMATTVEYMNDEYDNYGSFELTEKEMETIHELLTVLLDYSKTEEGKKSTVRKNKYESLLIGCVNGEDFELYDDDLSVGVANKLHYILMTNHKKEWDSFSSGIDAIRKGERLDYPVTIKSEQAACL